jgi:nicotinate dehydrogenase subunit A
MSSPERDRYIAVNITLPVMPVYHKPATEHAPYVRSSSRRALRPAPDFPRQEGTPMAEKYTLRVNGIDHSVEADSDMPLLYALRDDLGMSNPHFGCGLSQCGACTVHVDGVATRSCVTPISRVTGHEITTLQGLGTPDKPHPLQTAYVEEQVVQCGYCLNGWVMTAAAFLKTNKKPTDEQIRTALTGLKCRCGTHTAILRAVKSAAAKMA